MLWRHYRLKRILVEKNKFRYFELYLFGILISIGSIASTAIISWPVALKTSVPIMIIFPFAIVIFGIILLKQIDYRNTNFKLQESEERLKVTLLSIGDGVIATDQKGNITLINKVAEEITGWEPEVIGKPINSMFNIVDEYTEIKLEDPVMKLLDTNNRIGLTNHTNLIREDGTVKPIKYSASPIKHYNGNVQGAILIVRDVTEERKKERN